MESADAVTTLAALAQDSRLAIFRLLVEAGPEGMPAGAIGEHLGIPSMTLSFHLSRLRHAGLLSSRRSSRWIIYSVNFATMGSLMDFLTENCCKGKLQARYPGGGNADLFPYQRRTLP